ncbi:hypothetical protein RYX36_010861, partial [Vicia faba]
EYWPGVTSICTFVEQLDPSMLPKVPALLGLFYCSVRFLQLYLDEKVLNNVQERSLMKTVSSL